MKSQVKRFCLQTLFALAICLLAAGLSFGAPVHAASADQLAKQALGFYESRGSSDAAAVINTSVADGDTHLGDTNDATYLGYMLDALNYIDECNALRAKHGLSALKVNDYCMAVAQAQLNWSDTRYNHSHKYPVGENLSWGYSDPFDGWYTEEKQLYDSGVTDFQRVGHYLNIINSQYTATGFAFDTDQGNYMQHIAHGQTFDFSDGETVAQYRRELQAYCNQAGRVATKMYRLYNPNSGEHFYTANASERDSLKRAGWRDEGTGWTAPAFSTRPVYRFYNANAGDHHYTTNTAEGNSLVKAGWDYEGIGWFSDVSEGVPLYRQYNPNAKSGSHNYTSAKKENDHLVSLGWKAEGIGWYGMK